MILTLIFLIIAFISKAICDTLNFHFSSSIFSKIKNKKIYDWFDKPNSSNKMYKNGDWRQGESFFGSTTIFSFFIDAWHFFITVQLLSFILTITLYSDYKPIFTWYLDTLIIYIIYGLVFELFYGKVFKK